MTLTTPIRPATSSSVTQLPTAERSAAVRVSLVEPLPGFPSLLDWTLDPIDANGLLHSLRSVDEPELRFVLTPCQAFFPDYDTSGAADAASCLDTDDVEVLLVLTVGSSLQTATANLRAPVVVARSSGHAVQVVLEDPALSMRAPLVRAAA